MMTYLLLTFIKYKQNVLLIYNCNKNDNVVYQ